MAQRTIRFKDDVEQQIEARAKQEGRSFAGWVKRAVEKALGNTSTDEVPLATPAPPRPPKKTTGQRTPPRPGPILEKMVEADLANTTRFVDEDGEHLGYVTPQGDPRIVGETPPGCAECGGDIAVHPEFGRYCTGCGARVR